jgi:hypothetical protein
MNFNVRKFIIIKSEPLITDLIAQKQRIILTELFQLHG